MKNHQNGIKFLLMTRNLRTTIKTTLSTTQCHNQTSKSKINKKTVLKSRT